MSSRAIEIRKKDLSKKMFSINSGSKARNKASVATVPNLPIFPFKTSKTLAEDKKKLAKLI